MKQCLVASLIIMILLAACKKDKEKEETVSLVKKWNLENTIEKEYENGVLTDTYTIPGNGATIDFQDNGNVVYKNPDNTTDSAPYSLLPDSKVNIDGDIFEIKNLTLSTATLFIKEELAPWKYETTINLKR